MPAAKHPESTPNVPAPQPVLMVCVESFVALVDGGEVTALAGQTIVQDDSPLYKQCPNFFQRVQAGG